MDFELVSLAETSFMTVFSLSLSLFERYNTDITVLKTHLKQHLKYSLWHSQDVSNEPQSYRHQRLN